MMRRTSALLAAAALLLVPGVGSAQATSSAPSTSFGLGLVASSFRELGATGLEAGGMGMAGRLSLRAFPWLTLDGELSLYPSNLPGDFPLSAYRLEGLAGVRVGPAGGIRPHARLRPGFLRVGAAPEPLPCIRIFPPPLSCVLADGRTLFVVDVGAGVEADLTQQTFVWLDAGSQLTRFPGPASDRSRTVHEAAFFGSDLRLSVGVGIRSR